MAKPQPLLQDNVGVKGRFTAGQDGIGLFCPLVESETLDHLKLFEIGLMPQDNIPVNGPDHRLVIVTRHHRHQSNRVRNKRIQGEKLEDRVEQIGHTIAI